MSIDPVSFIAGAGGGLAAQSVIGTLSPWQRAVRIGAAATIGGFGAGLCVALLIGGKYLPAYITDDMLRYPVAVLLGLLSYSHIIPGINFIASRLVRLDGAK